ncbi:hypothetical protein [Herbidospora yilanensis]|uniref:hypothetical protein n=1 Tax=Herbidospora yilanensis TaxID=354426 RepID=UPI0007828B79|nr:hypothetical protein [Herbidospora yilanensis]
MSDDVLSVIPTDPWWRPGQEAAHRAAALAAELAPGLIDDEEVEIDVSWHETIQFVDSYSNLMRITCPLCGSSIDLEWWQEFGDAHADEGLSTLEVRVPCCSGSTSLEDLRFDWPCGFARFEIAIWNPDRASFDDDELAALGAALGHPVRQIRAHI